MMTTTPAEAAFEYSDLPPVLVFADQVAARDAAAAAVLAAGGRVAGALPLASALPRLSEQATSGIAVVEIAADSGDDLDALLDALDDSARSGRYASIIALPPHLIDVAAARAGHRDVTLLCEPEPFDRVAAIASALSQSRFRLTDVNAEGSGLRLRELADEVSRIAKTLATLASEDNARAPALMLTGETGNWEVDASVIRAFIRVRRMRDQFFPNDLFADPAWDMLLDLAAARLEGRAVAVSSLCIASAVPPTTALRWIKTMTDANLFARVADSTDGRRVFIELTDQAANAVMGYLAAIQRLAWARS